MQIEDGKGSGSKAGVSFHNRIMVDSVAVSVEHHINHQFGRAFNLLFDATPTGAGDCFLYMKNDAGRDLIVEGFWLKLVADEYIDIKLNDSGTPSGGGAIVPVNLNGGSGNVADGTFEDGNDITGLSGGSTSHRIYHASSTGSDYHNFNQDIIIPKNSTLTMYCQTGTTALAGMLVFNFHTEEFG